MIRHHVTQDLLSAEAAPMYFGSGMTAIPHAAPLPGRAETQDGSNYGPAATHPFAFYAAPLSTLVLLVVSIVALSALLKLHRETVGLRRTRDRYRAFVGSTLIPIPLPVNSKVRKRLR